MNEISLRDIIDIIIKSKKIIVGTLLVFIACGFLYGFILIEPVYEASSTVINYGINYTIAPTVTDGTKIILNSGETNADISEDIDSMTLQESSSLLSSMLNFKNVSEEELKGMVLSKEALSNVINKLNLNMSINKLRGLIKVTVDKNMISVKGENESKELVFSIVNELAQEYKDYIIGSNEQYFRSMTDNIDKLIAENEKNGMELNKQLNSLEPQTPATQADNLKSKVTMNTSIHEILLLKRYQLSMASDMDFSGSVIVTEKAELPESPIKPRKTLIIAIMAVAGLLMGILVALFINYWKKTTKL